LLNIYHNYVAEKERVMSKLGCLLGVLLDLVAFVILFGIIVIPALPGAENNSTIMGVLEPLLCKPGETLTQTTSVIQDSRGTSRSPHYYCGMEPNAQREVTGRAVLYGAVGFVGPFLVGLLLSIVGMTSMARSAARKTIGGALNLTGSGTTYETAPDGSMTINAGGIPVRIVPAARQAVPDLSPVHAEAPVTEKLKQLQNLLAQNLISQEEYDRLRGQILDESF
jgi:hypothetical protein